MGGHPLGRTPWPGWGRHCGDSPTTRLLQGPLPHPPTHPFNTLPLLFYPPYRPATHVCFLSFTLPNPLTPLISPLQPALPPLLPLSPLPPFYAKRTIYRRQPLRSPRTRSTGENTRARARWGSYKHHQHPFRWTCVVISSSI